MSEWEITYTEDKVRYDVKVVLAKSYTMALLEFIIRFPNFEYTEVKERKK